jgi:hypothetical protein
MCSTLNQFTAKIWYILGSGWRKWSDVELFESLNRKYHVKSWWNLEYFSVENILPKEFDKLTNVCFQLHPHANWHTQLLLNLKEKSPAHYFIFIFTWKPAQIFTLDDPKSHSKCGADSILRRNTFRKPLISNTPDNKKRYLAKFPAFYIIGFRKYSQK